MCAHAIKIKPKQVVFRSCAENELFGRRTTQSCSEFQGSLGSSPVPQQRAANAKQRRGKHTAKAKQATPTPNKAHAKEANTTQIEISS